MDAKCRWRSDWLDGAVSFREPLGQTKVMQIRHGETLNHQGPITHEVCCLAAQLKENISRNYVHNKFSFVDRKLSENSNVGWYQHTTNLATPTAHRIRLTSSGAQKENCHSHSCLPTSSIKPLLSLCIAGNQALGTHVIPPGPSKVSFLKEEFTSLDN